MNTALQLILLPFQEKSRATASYLEQQQGFTAPIFFFYILISLLNLV